MCCLHTVCPVTAPYFGPRPLLRKRLYVFLRNAVIYYFGVANNVYNNNNYNYYYYLLQLGCHPVAVVILHVYKI